MSNSLISFQPEIDEPSNMAIGQKVFVDRADMLQCVLPLAVRIGKVEGEVADILFPDKIK